VNASIAIIQFPGSNTERETLMACHRAGLNPVEFLWNEAPEKLSEFDGFVIVGGFSYEDRSRSGIIASLDPIMKQVRIEADFGKPVLGICNGAQITWANLQMSVPYARCSFTHHLKKSEWINIPLAHGEGRFIIPDEILSQMINNDQTVFRYCDNRGNVIDEFPTNPNGSVYNLAAVCNPAGNVMAMMPHPERTKNGDVIFFHLNGHTMKWRPMNQMVIPRNGSLT